MSRPAATIASSTWSASHAGPSVAAIFEEDKAACEAVHQVMKRNEGRPVIDINADGGHVLARRMVAKLVAAEQGARSAAAE